ncbi:hypothetical protein IW261DRAFT_1417684 [Armillaria novae-zelandiae]|uniref:Uncharacterized protein n=1 Tax=Armillaria novae-zelandiae TaxID=153914 RepID=A0AA39UEI7_9AGAR|nr:hypothetical protein IW261DRAFT_1417684 [Armillaria novae-zelandiae]
MRNTNWFLQKILRLENIGKAVEALKNGVKQTIECLSPQKKKRKFDNKKNHDNSVHAAASMMPVDLDPASNDDTFFAMPLVHNRVNVPLPETICHGFFDANSSSPEVPAAPPNQSYHKYTLHKPNGPLCKDIIAEDNESVLAFHSGSKGMVLDAETDGESDVEHDHTWPIANIKIKTLLVPDGTWAPPPTPIKEFNAFDDMFSATLKCNGKIQEAPSQSRALATLKDLHDTLYP